MKAADKSNNKKDKAKKKGGVNKHKPKKEQVLVVAQEIKYARWLSGNDKKTRDRVLKALKKWLTNCFEKKYVFKEEDFTRIWKGLFYSVWMSDKPLIQEELCENIAGILDLFPPEQVDHGLLMVKAGFKMLATEWYGIDQHRMDKFLMLVRRYLRGSLRMLKRCEWSLDSCQKYANMLSGPDGLLSVQPPHYARNAGSMVLHYIDCFLEELSKVSSGSVPDTSVVPLLRPFATYTSAGPSPALSTACRRLFTALLRYSQHGITYQDKTSAWNKMGCPEGGPDALELVSDDEQDPETDGDVHSDDDGVGPLDPRAGRVNVVLSPLPVPAGMLANMFRELLTNATSKAHRRLKICMERFEAISRGDYPLKVEPPPKETIKTTSKQSANNLRAFEHKLKLDADELKLRGLSRKHRKRLLKKTRAGLSIVDDVEHIVKTNKNMSQSGEWVVESTEAKTEDANKENQDKTKKKNAQKRSSTDAHHVNNKKQKVDKHDNNSIKKEKTIEKSKQRKNAETKTNETKNDNKRKHRNNTQEKPTLDNNKIKNEVEEKSEKKVLRNKVEKVLEIPNKIEKSSQIPNKIEKRNTDQPTFLANKIKKFQKQLPNKESKRVVIKKTNFDTPKKVKFELKNNSMQKPVDYYKSVRQSPNIPFDSSKKPTKTNLKPSTPSPINPFFKKKLRMK